MVFILPDWVIEMSLFAIESLRPGSLTSVAEDPTRIIFRLNHEDATSTYCDYIYLRSLPVFVLIYESKKMKLGLKTFMHTSSWAICLSSRVVSNG